MHLSLKSSSFKAMGSFCEIQIFAESRIDAKKILSRLTEEVARLEKKYSRFRNDSFLTEINRSADRKHGIEIDSETQSLLDHAKNCYETSDGLFDVTAGTLSQIWDFKNAQIPTQAQIDAAQTTLGFHKISWSDSRLRLPPNMQIDFGGIVKEYAADSVARLARNLGVNNGLVNLGGDFSVIGAQPDNRPWSTGIIAPDRERDIMAKIDLLQGGLASSGDYERFFMHKGKRYSHIMNPFTGWPCAGLRAVSVAANLCTVAGSVATIAMLKDEIVAKQWLLDSGLPHVYMDSRQTVGGTGINANS